MYTNQMRITGLSGIDTESMVTQLMKAESMKLTTLKKNNQLLIWKQEAYRSTATALTTFQSSFLSYSSTSKLNLRQASTFRGITSAITNSAGADSKDISVVPGSSAEIGKHTLEVISVASKDVYVSAESLKKGITGEGRLDATAIQADQGMKVTLDGVTKTITFDADDIIAIEAGANSDEKNSILLSRLNAKLEKAFGKEKNNDLKVSASVNANGNLVIGSTPLHTVSIGDDGTGGIAFLGTQPGSSIVNMGASLESIFGSSYFTNDTVSFSINGKDFTFDKTDTLETMMSKINKSDIGVKMSFDSSLNRVKIESTELGAAAAISLDGAFLTNALKFEAGNSESHIAEASDAIFKFDKMLTSRTTNTFTISNLTFNITDSKINETYNIGVNTDTSKALEAVTSFVEEYNKLIDLMNKEVGNPRPRSGKYSYYEPLSDEERKAMSADEIKLWEEKAKTGMLYRDDILRGITSSLRSFMYQSVELENGKSIALYEIGVTTSSKTSDGGKLIIDQDKLKKALEERIDDVATLFTKGTNISAADKSQYNARMKDQGLADRINDIINNATSSKGTLTLKAGISASDTSSYLYKQISAQEDRISDLLSYLAEKETYYYNMFSKMEAAMNQSNSQMSYLQSALGLA